MSQNNRLPVNWPSRLSAQSFCSARDIRTTIDSMSFVNSHQNYCIYVNLINIQLTFSFNTIFYIPACTYTTVFLRKPPLCCYTYLPWTTTGHHFMIFSQVFVPHAIMSHILNFSRDWMSYHSESDTHQKFMNIIFSINV